MAKKENPGWISGEHWAICDRCGFAYRQKELIRTWDGLWVCLADFEPRHPQEFVRSHPEHTAAKGLVRTVPTPLFIEVTYGRATTGVTNAIAGVAIAGLAITGT